MGVRFTTRGGGDTSSRTRFGSPLRFHLGNMWTSRVLTGCETETVDNSTQGRFSITIERVDPSAALVLPSGRSGVDDNTELHIECF